MGKYEALHDCFLTNEVSPSWGWHQADVGEALPQLARIEGEYGFGRPLACASVRWGYNRLGDAQSFLWRKLWSLGVCPIRLNDSMNYLCVNRSGTSICGFPFKAISTKKPTVGVGWTFSTFFLATDTFLMWITLYQVDLPGSHLFYFSILSSSISNDEPQLLSKPSELKAPNSAGFNSLDLWKTCSHRLGQVKIFFIFSKKWLSLHSSFFITFFIFVF